MAVKTLSFNFCTQGQEVCLNNDRVNKGECFTTIYQAGKQRFFNCQTLFGAANNFRGVSPTFVRLYSREYFYINTIIVKRIVTQWQLHIYCHGTLYTIWTYEICSYFLLYILC